MNHRIGQSLGQGQFDSVILLRIAMDLSHQFHDTLDHRIHGIPVRCQRHIQFQLAGIELVRSRGYRSWTCFRVVKIQLLVGCVSALGDSTGNTPFEQSDSGS